jgi:uncharacterized protein (UPF0332 family)
LSITVVELLEFASELHSRQLSSEAQHRTVVGKAYYAAYHDSLMWHEALPTPGSLAPNGRNGTHEQLLQRLSNPTGSTEKMVSKKRSYMLRALHQKRVTADYKLETSVSLAEASQALEDAKLVVALT